MRIDVVEGDAKAFFEVPFLLEPGPMGRASPMRSDMLAMLDPARNPLLRDGWSSNWTALLDGRPAGRIMGFEHRASNARHGTSRLQFGFFDVVDEVAVARALLDRVEAEASRLGLTEVAGPFDMTAMQQMGVVTSGFDARPYTDMASNPPHVAPLLERCGYERFFPMTTFELDLRNAAVSDESPLDAPGMRLEPVSRRAFRERMDEARVVLNDGFDRNPMFVPLTAEEFEFQAGGMMAIIDPRLSSVLTHHGRPVATVVCIPDLSGFMAATRSRVGLLTPWHYLRHRLSRRRAVVVFYSVATSEQGRGLNGAMLSRLVRTLRASGYGWLGVTWIGDGNPASLRQMERVGAKPLHRVHMFRKAVA